MSTQPTPETDAAKFNFSLCHPAINLNQEVVRVEIAQALEQQRNEAQKAYQTVKDWAHRLETQLTTLIDDCDSHADGSPDATALEKFCNEMIGKSNGIMLGEVRTLHQERDQLAAKVKKLEKDSLAQWNAAVEKAAEEVGKHFQILSPTMVKYDILALKKEMK